MEKVAFGEPYALRQRVPAHIIGEVRRINRVTCGVSGTRAATIEREKGAVELGNGSVQTWSKEGEPCCFMIESRPVISWPGPCTSTRGVSR